MSKTKKKVQTTYKVTVVYKRTYFIDVDEPDTDCLCYEPTDEEVVQVTKTEEKIL